MSFTRILSVNFRIASDTNNIFNENMKFELMKMIGMKKQTSKTN